MSNNYGRYISLSAIVTIFFIFLFDSSNRIEYEPILLQEINSQIINVSTFQGIDIRWYIQKEYSPNNTRLVSFN